MYKVLSLQSMKAKKEIELRAGSSLSINCKKYSTISAFIC
ncbi:class III lanthipeptide [Bacillus methanolicus]